MFLLLFLTIKFFRLVQVRLVRRYLVFQSFTRSNSLARSNLILLFKNDLVSLLKSNSLIKSNLILLFKSNLILFIKNNLFISILNLVLSCLIQSRKLLIVFFKLSRRDISQKLNIEVLCCLNFLLNNVQNKLSNLLYNLIQLS